jgi:very-short-patch-repair endonuclease
VFSSLIADDIRDEASTKPGVTALRAFLKLAKDGYTDAAEATSGRFGSEIEESVALAIRDMGYDVRPQVGMAGFFVDLGVLDPHNPDRYILGIECDGTAYHSSVYSRDRDRLRQSILEARGWRMHRIWSVDWFYRQRQELEKLKAALEAAVEGKPLPDDARVPWPTHQQVAESGAYESEQISPPALHGETDVDDQVFARPMNESGRRHSLAPYVLANFDVPERHNMQPHQLYPRRLGEIVTEIVKVEQPIHVEEVARRIAYLFGLQRAGSQINRTAVDGLYWAGDVLAKKGNFYRMANGERLPARDRSSLPSSATVRKPEYICPTEIAEAAREVLRWNLALDLDELVLETARALGFARTGPSIALAIKNAIEDELLGVGPALHRHAQLLAYPIKNAIEVETQGDVEIDHMGRIRLRAEGLPN